MANEHLSNFYIAVVPKTETPCKNIPDKDLKGLLDDTDHVLVKVGINEQVGINQCSYVKNRYGRGAVLLYHEKFNIPIEELAPRVEKPIIRDMEDIEWVRLKGREYFIVRKDKVIRFICDVGDNLNTDGILVPWRGSEWNADDCTMGINMYEKFNSKNTMQITLRKIS